MATLHQFTQNSKKKRDYSDIPSGAHKKIKGPAHLVEGGHHLRIRKAPNPHPQHTSKIWNKFNENPLS